MAQMPLNRFPLVHSKDPVEVELLLRRIYGIQNFSLLGDSRKFEATVNNIELPRIGLSFWSCTEPICLEFPEADRVRQKFVLQGHATSGADGSAIQIDASRSLVTPYNTAAKLLYSGNYQQLTVTISASTIAKHLAYLLGGMPKGCPDFGGPIDLQQPEAKRLLRIVNFLVREFDADAPELPPVLLAEMQDALVTAFIMCNQKGLANLIAGEAADMAPWQVRVAEEFIEANWQQPITVELLAENIGASARAIFKSFKDARGYSPRTFLKRVRLNHAHRMLASGDEGVSVTAVGLKCGFNNLGHFAKDYARVFGERPSETLSQTKQANNNALVGQALRNSA